MVRGEAIYSKKCGQSKRIFRTRRITRASPSLKERTRTVSQRDGPDYEVMRRGNQDGTEDLEGDDW